MRPNEPQQSYLCPGFIAHCLCQLPLSTYPLGVVANAQHSGLQQAGSCPCTLYLHGTEHMEWDRTRVWQQGKEGPMPFLVLVGAMGESLNTAHVGSLLPVVQRLLYNQAGIAACHYAQHFRVTAGTPSQPGSARYY